MSLLTPFVHTARDRASARPGSRRVASATCHTPVEPRAPGPGHESVWDYPRPPRVEATTDRLPSRGASRLNRFSTTTVW